MVPGLYPNIPAEQYHERRVGVVSKSALDLVNRSPAHYKAWIDGAPEEETDALNFGSAFHCALLEPAVYAKRYIVEPNFGDCRFKVNKEKKKAWHADHVGFEFVDADDATAISSMIAAVHAHPLAGKMIRDGQPELTVRWQDEETGLECKCRADYHVPRLRMVADFKSTLDARIDHFRKDVAKFGYHRQDALYRSGFEAVGEPVLHFVFIAVEKTPPHAIAIFALDAEAISRGSVSVRRDMQTLAECVKTDSWPGYSGSIQTIDLPPWAA